jgi:PEP-CTERM motif
MGINMKASSAMFGAALTAVAVIGVVATPAKAALATFSAFDDGQAAPIGPNSAAEQALFLAAAGAVNEITFETSGPSGVTINGGSIATGTLCTFALCGGNTTPGGSFYLSIEGGTATFNFATPISAFGAYFSGLQVPNTLTFDDGAPQSVAMPFDFSNGGMAFVGFTDPGASITSVTVNANNDIIGVDDVFYSGSTNTIPEPSTWVMMLAGFAGLGLTGYRRAKRGQAALA